MNQRKLKLLNLSIALITALLAVSTAMAGKRPSACAPVNTDERKPASLTGQGKSGGEADEEEKGEIGEKAGEAKKAH